MAGGLARSRDVAATATRELLRDLPSRDQIDIKAGARLLVLVLSCTVEDTIGVDLASTTMVRLRVPWHDGALPDLAAFDVVEATLAEDPERDDTAQPEAVTLHRAPAARGIAPRWRRAAAPQAATGAAGWSPLRLPGPVRPLLGASGRSAECRAHRPAARAAAPAEARRRNDLGSLRMGARRRVARP